MTPRNPAEYVAHLLEQAKLDNAEALYQLGFAYDEGIGGLLQSQEKAIDCWQKAAELGHTAAKEQLERNKIPLRKPTE